MKTPQQHKGQQGESLAAKFLQQKGYEIIVQNYRYRRGEIDLIAQKEQLLIFVEVKLRSSVAYGLPEETISENQQNLIMTTAEHYIEQNDWLHDIRFDIVAIQLSQNKLSEIIHFEDAFY